jgi:hypothetical protein
MKNVLTDYMRSRMEKKSIPAKEIRYGPVVTISREYGCPAKIVAQDLSIKLNNLLFRANKRQQWRWISKEILEESAKELKMNRHLIKNFVSTGNRGIMDDLIYGLSGKFYPGNNKVKKTLAEVIMEFVRQGRVIIVGRGGVSLTRNIKDSLHIRLVAPVDWRVQAVKERYQMTLRQAEKKVKEIDAKRDHLHEFFGGKPPEHSIFDIVFNFKTMPETEIIETIVRVMELRQMI